MDHYDSVRYLEKISKNQFLSCSYDKSIKLWDIETGSFVKAFMDDYGNPSYCLKIWLTIHSQVALEIQLKYGISK